MPDSRGVCLLRSAASRACHPAQAHERLPRHPRGSLIAHAAVPRPLVEQGLDSLITVEMRNRLSHAIGRRQPASVLFDHPTLERPAQHLLGEVLALGDERARLSPSPPTTIGRDAASDVVNRLTRLDQGAPHAFEQARFPTGAESVMVDTRTFFKPPPSHKRNPCPPARANGPEY
jgi:phosphopantetheine binding protein